VLASGAQGNCLVEGLGTAGLGAASQKTLSVNWDGGIYLTYHPRIPACRRGSAVGTLESLGFEPLLAGGVAPVLDIETPKMTALALASPRRTDRTNMSAHAYNVQEAYMRATPIGRNGYEAR